MNIIPEVGKSYWVWDDIEGKLLNADCLALFGKTTLLCNLEGYQSPQFLLYSDLRAENTTVKVSITIAYPLVEE